MVAAGADGLSLVNTIRGLALDPRTLRRARPRSRRLLRPGAAPDRARLRPRVRHGGRRARSSGWAASRTGRDALELVAAGATAVALGTVLFADPARAGSRIRAELEAEAARHAGSTSRLDASSDRCCPIRKILQIAENSSA